MSKERKKKKRIWRRLVLTFGIVLQKDRVLVRHQLLAGFRQELLAAKEFSCDFVELFLEAEEDRFSK